MSEPRHTKEDLRMMQALPLDLKIRLTQDRIRAWVDRFGTDGVYVSFSGGKDSTVLLHIVRELYPDVKAVFSNTGLEYPEIRQFAMRHDNVDVVYPEINFKDVLIQYGYPLINKEVSQTIYYARRIKRKEAKPRTGGSPRNGRGDKQECPAWYNYKWGERWRLSLQGFATKETNNKTGSPLPTQFSKERFREMATDLPVKNLKQLLQQTEESSNA